MMIACGKMGVNQYKHDYIPEVDSYQKRSFSALKPSSVGYLSNYTVICRKVYWTYMKLNSRDTSTVFRREALGYGYGCVLHG